MGIGNPESRRRVAVTAPLDGEPTSDAPLRRFFWVKRLALITTFLIVGLAALWWAWDARQRRRLDAEVAEWRRQGLPILRGDFEQPRIPDDRNAAVLVRRALDAVELGEGDIAGNVMNAESMPWPPALMRVAETSLAQSREALERARAIPSRTEVDWGRPPAARYFQNDALDGFTSLPKMRQLATDLMLDAQVAAQRQEAERFIDDALAAEALGFDVEAQPRIVPLLVGIGIDALADSIVNDYAWRLRFSGAARLKAQRLIADDWVRDNLFDRATRTICSEASYALENADAPARYWTWPAGTPQAVDYGPIGQAAWRSMRPIGFRDTATALYTARNEVAALRAPTWAAAMATSAEGASKAPPPVALSAEPAASLVQMFSTQPSGPGLFLTTLYRARTHRRMTAVLLACHLYRIDHGGYPASLAELVPTYLPAVPTDPYSPTGAPIGYHRDATGEPFIYSVFEGQKDLIAAGLFAPTVAQNENWRTQNFVIYLNPSRPMPAATLPAGWVLPPPPPPPTTSPAPRLRK